MKNSVKHTNPAIEQAAANFHTQLVRWARTTNISNSTFRRSSYNFTHLVPGMGVLAILEYVRNNPNCTRSDIKRHFIITRHKWTSQSTFQSVIWAGLITRHKYNLTDLGRQILAAYNL